VKDHPLGWVEHRFAYGPKGKYGQWIRANEAVIKVNDIIFMHGGWSPKYADKTIADLNTAVHFELADFNRLAGGIVMDTDGHSGIADSPGTRKPCSLNTSTNSLLTSRPKHRHRPHAHCGAVLTRFNGRVVMIDVGMSKFYGGPPACLVIEGDKRMAMHRGKLLDLPSDKSAMLAYLKAAAALDPQPSPLQKLIDAGLPADMVKDDK